MLEQALIEALNRCRRDGVKPTARNAAMRLSGNIAFYSLRSVEYKLAEMIRRGLIEKPSKRGGYIPKVHRLEYCPTCGQALPIQLSLPLSIAN